MPKPYYPLDKSLINSMIRVNHAGEFAAKKIYQGQIAASKSSADKKLFQQMLEQEAEHLAYFEQLLQAGKSRPTLLIPIWRHLGYLLGLISQKLGTNTAMLVTEKIEETIIKHYQEQIELLRRDNLSFEQQIAANSAFLAEFLTKLEKFKADEAEHLHIAVENDSANSILPELIGYIVQRTCIIAINLSKII